MRLPSSPSPILFLAAIAWVGLRDPATRAADGEVAGVRALAAAVERWSELDEEGALASLASIDEATLPPAARAAYGLFRAEVALERGLPRAALAALDRAAAVGGNGPRMDQLRSMAAVELGRWSVALDAAQAVKRALPVDQRSLGCALVGDALRGQRRLAAARAEYTEGLASDSNDPSCLVGLALASPPEDLATMRAAFSRSTELVEQLDFLADRLLAANRNDALEVLLAEAERRAPGDVAIGLCRVQALVATGEDGRAADQLLSLRPAVPDEEWESEWEEEYLELMDRAGRLAEAYRPGPDARRVFRRGGELLIDQEDPERLTAWVERHLASDPRDPALAYFAGVALLQDDKFDSAERELQEGLTRAEDPADRRQFLEALWETRHAAGRTLAAYRKAEDRRAAFRFLAGLCIDDEDADLFESLLALHREQDAGDPWLGLAEIERAWLRKEYEAIVRVARAGAVDPMPEEAGWAELARERHVRALVRLGRLEEALGVARRDSEHARDPWYAAIVHAVGGDVPAALAEIERCLEFGDEDLIDFLLDEDAGPALESPPFAGAMIEWRVRGYDLSPAARLVLLEQGQPALDRAALTAALAKAFPETEARLLGTTSPWEIRLADVWIHVAVESGPAVSWPDGVPADSFPRPVVECVARQRGHCILSVFPIAEAIDPARIRFVVGRLAAELTGPATLGVYSPAGDRLLVADQELPSKLKLPKPTRLLGELVPLTPREGAGP